MAVTKIRKISSWILWAVAAISIVFFGLFYFGGVVDPSAEKIEPVYTSQLLYWGYTIFGLAIAALICFGVFQFVLSMMSSPKKALASLSVIVVFLALLGVFYAMGNDTPLPNINTDSAQYNVPFWLKMTDMWLYTMYTLGVLCILTTLAGSLKGIIKK